jgi:glycine dehydrogenase
VDVFASVSDRRAPRIELADAEAALSAPLVRTSAYLTHPVFNTHHSETNMMRYIRMLERRTWGSIRR